MKSNSVFQKKYPSPANPIDPIDRISQILFGETGEEKRLETVETVLNTEETEWNQRMLLWLLAGEHIEIRKKSWEILNQQKLDYPLLIQELSCPLWQVRVGVICLMAKTGRLNIIKHLLTGLDDYHPNVVEETKQSLNRLIETAELRKSRGQLSTEELQEAMSALFQIFHSPKRSPRYQAVPSLFKIAKLAEDIFWKLYSQLELPQYTLLHEEFIRYQSEGVLELLYRGLLQDNPKIVEQIAGFLSSAIRICGEKVNFHLDAVHRLPPEELQKIAVILHRCRILVEFQGIIKFMNPPERMVLFDLLEVVGAEQNLPFLLRCLQLDDTRIRIRVLKILGESESVELRNEVFEFLNETDEQLLLAVLRYLQNKGNITILEKISPLTRSLNKKIRQSAVNTLFIITRDHLLRDFYKISSKKRLKILEWLRKIKPNLLEEMRYLSESPEESDQLKYLGILEAEGLTLALPEYRRLAENANPIVRATAVKGFARVKDETLLLELIRPFLMDADNRVRANAIEITPNTKPENPEIIQWVRKASTSQHRREKANALAKLLNWGFTEYESVLAAMLDNKDTWTKVSALWVIGVVDISALVVRLREAANDSRAPVRKMAIRGIGLKGTEDDIRALMPFLKDPSREVREAAQHALRNRLHLSFEIT